jgi:GTPase SAR1 family protein
MGDNGKAFGKLVIVGDGAVGKTCLLDRLTKGDKMSFDPEKYIPTTASNSKVETETSVDGERLAIELDVWVRNWPTRQLAAKLLFRILQAKKR